jgi:hypothetical protein
VPEVAVSEELFVSERFAFLQQPLGSFSGLSDFLDSFDRYLELSCFVAASHVGVQTLKGMFLLEGSNLFREMQVLASLSEIARDFVQFHFAHK